jgi:hypothetical protein
MRSGLACLRCGVAARVVVLLLWRVRFCGRVCGGGEGPLDVPECERLPGNPAAASHTQVCCGCVVPRVLGVPSSLPLHLSGGFQEAMARRKRQEEEAKEEAMARLARDVASSS